MNLETINFTASFTLSDPDSEEGTIPDKQQLERIIGDALEVSTRADVLHVSVELDNQE